MLKLDGLRTSLQSHLPGQSKSTIRHVFSWASGSIYTICCVWTLKITSSLGLKLPPKLGS